MADTKRMVFFKLFYSHRSLTFCPLVKTLKLWTKYRSDQWLFLVDFTSPHLREGSPPSWCCLLSPLVFNPWGDASRRCCPFSDIKSRKRTPSRSAASAGSGSLFSLIQIRIRFFYFDADPDPNSAPQSDPNLRPMVYRPSIALIWAPQDSHLWGSTVL
jgi:hypothetical protein